MLIKYFALAVYIISFLAVPAFGGIWGDLAGKAIGAGVDWMMQDLKNDDLYEAVWDNVKSAAEIKAMIENGADVNSVHTDQNFTPLIAAGFRNTNPEVAKILIQAGADINARETALGETALVWACAKNKS